MLAGGIAELRVLDDLGVARGIPTTVEGQHTAILARSDSLAAVEAVARRHGMLKNNRTCRISVRNEICMPRDRKHISGKVFAPSRWVPHVGGVGSSAQKKDRDGARRIPPGRGLDGNNK